MPHLHEAAASEMKTRLFERLETWLGYSQDEWLSELRRLQGATGEWAEKQDVPYHLFEHALRTVERCRMQTIHSFCHDVLGCFPLEAGLSFDGVEIIEDVRQQALQRRAFHACMADIDAMPSDHMLAKSMRSLALGGVSMERIMATAHISRHGTQPEDVAFDDDMSLRQFVEQEKSHAKAVMGALGHLEPVRLWWQAQEEDRRCAMRYGLALWHDYLLCFLTTGHEWRQKGVGGNVKANPSLKAYRDFMDAWRDERRRYYGRGVDMACVARHALYHYEALKKRERVVDYDDLVSKTRALLQDNHGMNMVMETLDRGIRHILVDEAQDTSPQQWGVIRLLADEILAGEGQKEEQGTIFAVGDFKQSIYSFQGAQPKEFSSMREHFAEKVSKESWRPAELTESWRSNHAIMTFVDTLVQATDSFSLGEEEAIRKHRPSQDLRERRGLVELWPRVDAQKAQKHDWTATWVRTDEQDTSVGVVEQIASKIKALIDSGETLDSKRKEEKGKPIEEGEPIDAGDIMVLVRQRSKIVPALARALREKSIAIEGLDRLRLTEHIAVMDMMALMRFVLLPEDDMTLATILTSPLCALREEDIASLLSRKQDTGKERATLWQCLCAAVKNDKESKYMPAHTFLQDMMAHADYDSVFAFLTHALVAWHKRHAFFERMGDECEDIFHAFLHSAQTYDRCHTSSLQGFLHWLEQGVVEIKREPQARGKKLSIRTIHGAKGLEAPIIILAESAIGKKEHEKSVKDATPQLYDGIPIWSGVKENRDPQWDDRREQKLREAQQEENRLLYVALTRAKDRLYIAGCEGKGKKKDDKPKTKKKDEKPETRTWYDHVEQAFDTLSAKYGEGTSYKVETGDEDADFARRLTYIPKHQAESNVVSSSSAKEQRMTPRATGKSSASTLPSLPSWALQPQRPQRVPRTTPRALSPLYEEDGHMGMASPLLDDKARRHGLAVHAMLEYLSPSMLSQPMATWRAMLITHPALAAYSQDEKDDAWHEVCMLLQKEDIRRLLAEPCRREVPIMGDSGQAGHPMTPQLWRIDRLIDRDTYLLIIDYKTDRAPPKDSDAVPPSYQRQMGRYAQQIALIYPTKEIQCSFLWTKNASLMAWHGQVT